MSETEQIANEQPDAEVEKAVEAKPDNKGKPAKKAAVKGIDPINRFSGDGVVFRAKLFGTADVKEPRGDHICATAMNLLKAAVKTTGEHKQKILLKINLNGIVLLDIVTQTKLYEHSVNKISFIAKDPTDNRAFGYIIGGQDGSHMYFGIKTERAAEQVVITLKELFQTVFDMKKKEAELKGKTSVDADTVQSPTTTQETAAPSTTQQAPAATSPQPESAPAPTQEPTLGDETDAAVKSEVKREDSQSHLLDLLDNLSFVSSPAAPAAVNGQFGQQANPNAAWGNSINPNVAPGWANSTPAQNDPFAGMFTQQQQFNQPAAFPPQNQQPAAQSQFQSTFTQPNPMPSYNQQQPFNQPQLAQQNPFNTQTNAGMFVTQQVPVNGSPFASSAPAAQPATFTTDPFATGFQTNPQPQQPPASNPFASGNESFGVLQPQQVPQPSSQIPATNTTAPGNNLFFDLNPLPGTNSGTRKDQFFSDVKNPPKPKLNELQPTQPTQQQPANTTNPFAIPNQSQPVAQPTNPLDLDWLENRSQSAAVTDQPDNQPSSSTAAPTKQGLLPPPPSNIRQRQSNLGHTAVGRPR